MKVLLAAALFGGLLGFALFWPHGALTGLLGALLGASALAFLMSPVLALRRAKVERKQSTGFKFVPRALTGEDRPRPFAIPSPNAGARSKAQSHPALGIVDAPTPQSITAVRGGPRFP